MANKNKAGSLVQRAEKRADRLVKEIDKRTRTGEDRDNVDRAYQNHSLTQDGDRVWSF